MSTDADFNSSDVPVEKQAEPPKKTKRSLFSLGIGGVVVVLIAAFMVTRFFTTIPAGHVGVGTLFGKVQSSIYTEGIHVINPLVKITLFDARQKTHKEAMGVPSSDQLITKFDLSIQYRLIKEQAPVMLKETGTPKEVLEVHMLPLLRSLMREIGKSVARAENFYEQAVQQRIQEELLAGLSNLAKKGIKIEKLLIRDVTLPSIITNAVMRKKEAAQAAEKAKEELKKFKVDQERKEAQAEAEKRAELIQANKKKEVMLIGASAQLEAARIEAQSVLVKAEAEAEAKRKIIDAITLEGYLKLESMSVLRELQGGNHLIILDPNTTSPLPFLNLDKIRK
ncbi:MAG: SPFH domain-containing protein [Desulfobacter sp.]